MSNLLDRWHRFVSSAWFPPFGLVVALAAGWVYYLLAPLDDARQGHADAQADIHAGKLVLHALGEHPPWADTYYRLLRERYGIVVEQEDSAGLHREVVNKSRAYNATMQAEMHRRFGADVFKRAQEEARRNDVAPFHP